MAEVNQVMSIRAVENLVVVSDEFFGALPDELVLLIFARLPFLSVTVVSKVCQRWLSLVRTTLPLTLALSQGDSNYTGCHYRKKPAVGTHPAEMVFLPEDCQLDNFLCDLAKFRLQKLSLHSCSVVSADAVLALRHCTS